MDLKLAAEEAVEMIEHEHAKMVDNIYAEGGRIGVALLDDDEKRLVAHRMHWEHGIDLEDLAHLFRTDPAAIGEWTEWGTMAYRCRCGAEVNLSFRTRKDYVESGVGGVICKRCNHKAFCDDVEARVAIERATRLAELRAMPYEEYLLSDEWKARRDRQVKADGGACRLCGYRDNLNVHHRTYERLCEEAPLDLITLCYACHQNFHENRHLSNGPAPPGSTASAEG